MAALTYGQLRAGYSRNAAGLAAMAARAQATGRKVNGFTAESLADKAALYRVLAMADDASLAAHLEDAAASVRAARAKGGR